ncbi:MAG: hypothetical protein LJE96_03780 [Deltaproteobacteria bacterium]|nr:hypothetical protein [Deltaproteobacteria bacterium]
MAEIKSTMDIIMEKAKNLTVTDEDKKEFAAKEAQNRIRGLFQKYLDGVLSLNQFKTELTAFAEDQKQVAEKELLAECFSAMTVEGDNQPLFEVLERALECDIRPVFSVMDAFLEQQRKERNKKALFLIQALKERGVSGSAVIPNLKADSTWRDYLSDMQERFQGELKTLNLCP